MKSFLLVSIPDVDIGNYLYRITSHSMYIVKKIIFLYPFFFLSQIRAVSLGHSCEIEMS